ncbi:MAG: DNA internalization-related competence protein ComEC/Rec2 [Nitrosospira sp.]
MQKSIVAFTFGIWLLQQQPILPYLGWVWVLLLCAAPAFLLCRSHTSILAAASKILLIVSFAVAGFFWAAALAHWRLADALPHEWEGRDIQLIGVIAELPQAGERGLRFTFDVEQVLTPGAMVPAHIFLTWYDNRKGSGAQPVDRSLGAGERWRLAVRLKRPHGSINPHGFDFEQWALERDIRAAGYVRESEGNLLLAEMAGQIPYRIERLRQTIRENFLQALSQHEYRGILVALAVGDQRAIPREQWKIFTRTGVNHLMSISGLHVTMVSGLLFTLMYASWRRSQRLVMWLPARKAAVLAGLAAALGYALLAGFAIPAQRTVYMLAVVALALWRGWLASATSVLAWALLAVVMLDPWAVLAPGFWLSFGAIGLILLISTGRIGKTNWLTEWIRVQWAITLGLIPLLLAMFQQVSLVSPLANAIAIPLVSLVVVPLTLLGALPPFEFLLLPAHAVLNGCMQILAWLGDLPQAVWTQHAPPAWAVVAGLAGVAWMLLPGRFGWGLGLVAGFPSRWLGIVALLPIFFVLPARPKSGELWLTVLDVGQGLAVVARTKNHTLLYDTGPGFNSEADSGSRIIVPFLRAEGIQQLDTMIVTHSDSDHSGGALSVLEAVPVKRLISSLDNEHPIQLAVEGKERCMEGQSWSWDGIRFDVLHPSGPSYGRPGIKPNGLSCVLKITTAYGSVLLPADIERKTEYELLKHYSALLGSTVLLAPHHGSRTSSTEEFVRQVDPRLVIFSVGYRNRFGHPEAGVLERYRTLGSMLLRSDMDGAVMLRFGDSGMMVETSRILQRRYWHEASTM